MRIARAVLLRFVYGLVSLIFISFITFLADEVAPGDAATVRAGEKATKAQLTLLRHQMGLDRPMMIRYGEWLGKAARFDFGESYYGTKEPVTDIVKRNLPTTLKIATSAILLAAILGIFFGTLAAVWENRFLDRTVLSVSTLGVTLPNFVLAPILIYVFALKLDRLPQNWTTPLAGPEWMYLLLPVVVLSARPTAMLTRLTRASMVETLKQEFIKLAIAKGVPTNRLIFRHALRNAILPVVTAIGTSFGFLLTGSFVVETFFTLPGIGREAIEAIQKGNMPVVQACILITGLMFITINTLVDMVLPILDPRIRESQV
ncbi:MAG: ABC transporter permease [Armatimonadetes bacterium]|nr:ABC transporter permease [Armatimonadota bacterium]